MEGRKKRYRNADKLSKSTWLTTVVKKMKQFGAETNLHGFHHISDDGSSYFKRISFFIICCLSIIFCVYLIWLQLQRYQNNIVTTSIISTSNSVAEVQFPSVIICNNNIVYRSSAERILKNFKFNDVPDSTINQFFANLPMLISLENFVEVGNFSGIYKILGKFGFTLSRFMKELAQPCEKMLKKCYWRTKDVPCLNLFKLVSTTVGYCCGFNQRGFKIDERDTTVSSNGPQYARGAGPAFGLRVILDVEEDEYYTTDNKIVVGFSVGVMPSSLFPPMESYGNSLLQNEEMTLYLKPTIITSTLEVKKLSAKTRKCYLEDEGNLSWNSMYSFQVCVLECKVRVIRELCDCIPYYYPQEADTPTCTFENIPCLSRNMYNYNSLAVTASTEDGVLTSSKNKQCYCYPECDDTILDYYADMGKAAPFVSANENFTNISIVNVYFKHIKGTKMERRVYLTWDSLLASVGGIFGLCLGGSVLSLIECFYYIGRTIEPPVKNLCEKNKKKIIHKRRSKSIISPIVNKSTLPTISFPQQYQTQKRNMRMKSKTKLFLSAFKD